MNNIDKNKRFIIGTQVEFIPSQRELVDIHSGKKIRLQVPASLCFKKLLDANGRIVSQQELILCGWGPKRHASINANTYYQSILHLRRSLAKLGLEDIIDTVPRYGLKLNGSIHIEVTYSNDESSQSGLQLVTTDAENSQTTANVSAQPADGSGVDNVESPGTRAQLENKIPPAKITPSYILDAPNQAQGKRPKLPLKYIALVLIPVIAIALFYHITHKPALAFANYISLDTTPCHIYSKKVKYTDAEAQELLQEAGLSCQSDSTLFLATSPMNSQLNIIYCSRYTSKEQDCRSVSIMKKMKEPQ
ncbi:MULTISPECIES: winged helix-turn-helix domain-containing protein [Enterobacteriaceae]|uniref:OmpR/PhoB-type domain-containing protein n=1 Tax=Raoultella lignicola TaxID=3040939 RepID=A0ABU9F844_9ENTR|nr:hypothetical protein [Enterobacter sp. JUb54]QNK07576.1 hypothetical protein HF679_22930 [Enterobacter sp. JUb54]